MARTLISLLYAAGTANGALNTGYADALYRVQLMRQAARVAINRTVAGVHFPVDSAAGAMLGLTLGEYLTRRFRARQTYSAWSFIGRNYPVDRDFDWSDWYEPIAGDQTAPNPNGNPPIAEPIGNLLGHPLGAASPILVWLWNKALAEWR